MNGSASDPTGLRLALAWTRLLLTILAADLRREHGGDMLEWVRARWLRERAGGRRWVTAYVVGAVTTDLIRTRFLPRSFRRRVDTTRSPEYRSGVPLMTDLRGALRRMRRKPAFAAAVVSVLAIGIGVDAAMYTVIDRVLLRPVPVPNGASVVLLSRLHVDAGFSAGPGGARLELWRHRSKTLSEVATYVSVPGYLRSDQGLERVWTTAISANYMQALGVAPLAGRAFGTEDLERQAPVVLLTKALWDTRFGSDPNALGQTIEVDGVMREIVGVYSEEASVDSRIKVDLWIPLDALPGSEEEAQTDMSAFGLLAPGADLDSANEEASMLESSFLNEEQRGAWRSQVKGPTAYVGGDLQRGLWVLFGAVGLVLLIACANAANLLLADSVHRRPEIMTRRALGARRGALFRAVLVETALLSFVGGAVGIGFARLVLDGIARFKPMNVLEGIREFQLSLNVVVFIVALSLAVGVTMGVVLGLRITREGERAPTPDSRGGASRSAAEKSRGLLIAGQVAVAVLLAVGATLLSRSLIELGRANPGFRLENTVVFQLNLPEERYPDPETRNRTIESMTTAIENLQGVESVTLSNAPPFQLSIRLAFPMLEGDLDPESPDTGPPGFTAVDYVRPGFFRASGIPLLRGRRFEALPDPTGYVLVNRGFAERYGPERPVVGERLRFPTDPDGRWNIVLGVVENVRAHGPDDLSQRPQVYYPLMSSESGVAHFLVRGRVPTERWAPSLRTTIASFDADLPLQRFRTGEEIMAEATSDARFMTLVFGSLSLLSLLLAGVGVYAVISVGLRRRTRELGIRHALGAKGSALVRAGLRGGAAPVVYGLVAGTGASLLAVRIMKSLLFGITGYDPLSFGLAIGVIVGMAGLAMLLPSLRALRLDPTITMRVE